jgi:hypothetical protein
VIWGNSLSLRFESRAVERRHAAAAVSRWTTCMVRAVSFSSARFPLRELRVGAEIVAKPSCFALAASGSEARRPKSLP